MRWVVWASKGVHIIGPYIYPDEASAKRFFNVLADRYDPYHYLIVKSREQDPGVYERPRGRRQGP